MLRFSEVSLALMRPGSCNYIYPFHSMHNLYTWHATSFWNPGCAAVLLEPLDKTAAHTATDSTSNSQLSWGGLESSPNGYALGL